MFMEWIRILLRTTLPKLICKSNTTPIKVPAVFFTEIGKPTLKFICKCKRARIAKIILKEKS